MSHYNKPATVKSTPIPLPGLPPGSLLSLTGRTGLDSTFTPAPFVEPITLPVTMDASDLPENVVELRRMVAKLRTEVGLKNDQLQQAYEKQANRKLRETVELEGVNFQKQIDDYKEYANEQIAKAWAETTHWQEQVKIICDLLEQQTQEAERIIAGLKGEVAHLSGKVPKETKRQNLLTGKTKKQIKLSGKLKKQLEGD